MNKKVTMEPARAKARGAKGGILKRPQPIRALQGRGFRPRSITFILLISVIFTLSACSLIREEKIALTDAKMATAVDEKLMPVRVTDVFPRATQKVSCWFQWKSAKINTQLLARWHYITDDIHILDYTFNIPKKEGTGSVMLSMPDDKSLPSGQYKIDLVLGKRILRSLTFRIE